MVGSLQDLYSTSPFFHVMVMMGGFSQPFAWHLSFLLLGYGLSSSSFSSSPPPPHYHYHHN